ncbi:33901_t:CDS:1, partial [Gigaspora margarita]
RSQINCEGKLSNIKFLGIFLHREKEVVEVKKKLKGVVSLFMQKLKHKKMMASQLVYINNQVLLPKLEYMPQAIACSRSRFGNNISIFSETNKKKIGYSTNSTQLHSSTW